MNDFNATTAITKQEVLKFINDLNSTIMSEKEVVNLMNEKLLSNVDGINSMIGNSLTLFWGVLTFITIFIVIFSWINRSKIVDEVLLILHRKLNIEIKMIEEEFHRKLTKNLRYYIKQYKDEAQKEEFVRNVMLKNLSELLADEIRVDGEYNQKEVFNLYADRLYLVSQLTSNNEKEVKKALKKLSTGTYNKIIRLQAFKEYLDILEKKIDIDVTIELYEVKKIILSRG